VIVAAATRGDARRRGLAEAVSVFPLLEVWAVVAVVRFTADTPPWPPAPRWAVTVETHPVAPPDPGPDVLDNLDGWGQLLAAIYGPTVQRFVDVES
jgi:hypothetical protein